MPSPQQTLKKGRVTGEAVAASAVVAGADAANWKPTFPHVTRMEQLTKQGSFGLWKSQEKCYLSFLTRCNNSTQLPCFFVKQYMDLKLLFVYFTSLWFGGMISRQETRKSGFKSQPIFKLRSWKSTFKASVCKSAKWNSRTKCSLRAYPFNVMLLQLCEGF